MNNFGKLIIVLLIIFFSGCSDENTTLSENCQKDYVKENNLCINTKQQLCAENTSKPENSKDIIETVTATYSDSEGWIVPQCNWECLTGFELREDSLSCLEIVIDSADFYVSPVGNPNATGTYEDPIDLATAVSSTGPVTAGKLVVLKEGLYKGRYISTVYGTLNNPVKFVAEKGKRVTIDGNEGTGEDVLYVKGEWVQFIGLEITNSNTNRNELVNGIRVDAPYSKIINCVIHDNSLGISFWTPAIDSELYGNIIYNNGWQGDTRGHGHAIYTQNAEGTKQIKNNIIFFGYGFGIHAYTEGGSIQGFNFEKNIWFRTGASLEGESLEGTSDGLLIGGLQPVDRTVLKENYSWVPDINSRSVRFGWGSTVTNKFIELRDNYFVGNAVTQGYWENATVENNQFYGAVIGPAPNDFPNNTYSNILPTEEKVVIQKNEYDSNRIDIIVYNWNESATVSVNLNNITETGKKYNVYSVFDLWGTPVSSGIFNGTEIIIPMGTKEPVQPNGFPHAITGNDNPGKKFGAFIIQLTD